MTFLYFCLFAAGIVAADQITKILVVQNIPLYSNVEAIDGLFHLTYVQNTGAAWSMMQGMRWVFVALFVALTVLVLALASGTPLTGYGAVNFATAAAMAVLCTLLGHSVFNWALKYLPPAFVSTVKLLEPVISALWGLLIFREVPGLSVVLGGALTIFGIALYSRESET